MKSIALAPACPSYVAAALLCFSGAIHPASAAQVATDPNLNLTISCATEGAVLSWFGSNAVSYQVEASADLIAWTNASLVLTGGGAFLFVTNPIVGQN
jgi:hypothetical protein